MASDLTMCYNEVGSHFVQVGGTTMIQLDLHPFLTPSHVNGGLDTTWYLEDHFEETLMLLRPVLESSVIAGINDNAGTKKVEKSKDCILTGDTVRVACNFKQQQQHNLCLITQFASCRNKENKVKNREDHNIYQPVRLHREKVVAYVCPRASSSILQLSQFVSSDAEKSQGQEDISKYFAPSHTSVPSTSAAKQVKSNT